jgi:hypothetical protein
MVAIIDQQVAPATERLIAPCAWCAEHSKGGIRPAVKLTRVKLSNGIWITVPACRLHG